MALRRVSPGPLALAGAFGGVAVPLFQWTRSGPGSAVAGTLGRALVDLGVSEGYRRVRQAALAEEIAFRVVSGLLSLAGALGPSVLAGIGRGLRRRRRRGVRRPPAGVGAESVNWMCTPPEVGDQWRPDGAEVAAVLGTAAFMMTGVEEALQEEMIFTSGDVSDALPELAGAVAAAAGPRPAARRPHLPLAPQPGGAATAVGDGVVPAGGGALGGGLGAVPGAPAAAAASGGLGPAIYKSSFATSTLIMVLLWLSLLGLSTAQAPGPKILSIVFFNYEYDDGLTKITFTGSTLKGTTQVLNIRQSKEYMGSFDLLRGEDSEMEWYAAIERMKRTDRSSKSWTSDGRFDVRLHSTDPDDYEAWSAADVPKDFGVRLVFSREYMGQHIITLKLVPDATEPTSKTPSHWKRHWPKYALAAVSAAVVFGVACAVNKTSSAAAAGARPRARAAAAGTNAATAEARALGSEAAAGEAKADHVESELREWPMHTCHE